MKTLKKIGFFAIWAGLVIACDPIRGTLNVQRTFTVKVGNGNDSSCFGDHWPCDNPEEIVTIQPGNYSMKLEMATRKDARIRLDVGRRELALDLSIPKGKEIPATGSVALYSQETGQPFDLQIQTQTDVSETDTTRGSESCEIRWQEKVCGIRPGPIVPHRPPPGFSCWMQEYVRPGEREVEYFYRTTTQKMQSSLHQSGSQVGQFSGSRTETNKIYTYQGACLERRIF